MYSFVDTQNIPVQLQNNSSTIPVQLSWWHNIKCFLLFLFSGEPLLGYIHEFSAGPKFSTCQIQTSATKSVKAICFSPTKAHALRQAATKKSPIKIQRYDFNTQYDNIVINNGTQVHITNEDPSFQAFETSQMSTIQKLKTLHIYQFVSFKACIHHLGAPRKQIFTTGAKMKRLATLVDDTDSITAYFYGDFDDLDQGNTYQFTNMQLKKDTETNEMFLANPPNGFEMQPATPFSMLAEIKVSPLAMSSKTADFTILGIKSLSKYNSCSSCSKKATQRGNLLHCQHCDLRQRITASNQKWYSRLYVENKEDGKKFYVTTFDAELRAILKLNDVQLSTTSTETCIEEALLTSQAVNMTYSISNSKIISVNKWRNHLWKQHSYSQQRNILWHFNMRWSLYTLQFIYVTVYKFNNFIN